MTRDDAIARARAVVCAGCADEDRGLLREMFREVLEAYDEARSDRALASTGGLLLVHRHEIVRAVGLPEDAPGHEVVAAVRELRDRALYAEGELSAAFGLPSTMGPAPGWAKRVVDSLRARAERAEAQLAAVTEAVHDARSSFADVRVPGHDGDEESGEHDDGCEACAIEAARAALDAVVDVLDGARADEIERGERCGATRARSMR